eukprot:TRINITY_DN95962_c0_g1_i1.p1 TRINITY_DN95962_c0_g1~~TRINITY_DN95962_c0_g1_i1.p1  ORF type:complete len:164 (-),score=24.70 TRINITY_DN95962_c0_g1_i1:164-655(-)
MLSQLYSSQNLAILGKLALPQLSALSIQLSRRFVSDDSHNDFQTQYKANPESDVTKIIENDIKDNSVFIYMKGHPEVPMCGFSRNACMVLNAYGVEYGHRNVLEDQEIREGIKQFSGWPTIPQVFVEGEFLGGFDTLFEMHEKGELEPILKKVYEKQQSEKQS